MAATLGGDALTGQDASKYHERRQGRAEARDQRTRLRG